MKMCSQKARLRDIAKHAGIGFETVDRILNEHDNN